MKEEGAGVRQATEGVDPSHLNLRNKGVKTAGGKLHRGCVKDAFSKLSIGSIPSNYESIIYRYEEKKGFGTSQKRFYNPTSMSEMLKAEIDLDESIQSPVKTMHASHSTKGFGPFIAKEKRQWRKYTQTPGPGKYFDKNKQHPGQSPHIKKMHSYTRQRQDFKRKELAMNKQNHDIPGPGYYEYQQALDQHSLGGCKSSFVTKSTRQAYINKNNYPGPGRYHSDQPPVQEKKKEIMEEQLYTKLSKQKQTITSQFLPRQRAPQMPGPGYYDQQIPNFKPLYERIKISHNFIKGSKERLDEPLGYLQVTEGKGPTPCTYEVAGGYDKMQRKLIDMSSFMSESRRIVFEGSPSCSEVYYDKVKDQPKNFHFNISGKWV